MPVKLGSKLPSDSAEARIEIIPLIDIMFFLLAAFMLVSLSMVNLKGVKVNLPTAVSSTSEPKKDFVDISVDKDGVIYLDKKLVADNELIASLVSLQKANPVLRVFISGDQDARHGRMIRVLDLVRQAGIDKVAFETRLPAKAVTP
ncbi:MAG TPA: biopolymer transporter ExbD [Tepidisphaeraceae bacterium]|jgi:biopolymer transport protein ExbD|nr:biopolymer transporter ExbD [Tepidisphaeraceae bacterium]